MQEGDLPISMGELRTLSREGPLWGGVTKRGNIPADLLRAESQGFIVRNPNGEGYVIGPAGEHLLRQRTGVCPHCGA